MTNDIEDKIEIVLFDGNKIICGPDHLVEISMVGKIKFIKAKNLELCNFVIINNFNSNCKKQCHEGSYINTINFKAS